MYKVTLSRGYMDFRFIFPTIEHAARFIEDALNSSESDIKFTIELNKKVTTEQETEESEVESNDVQTSES